MPRADPGHDDDADAGTARELAAARRARDAAARLVERAHQEAALQGLCGEGAFEYALDRLRHADPAELVHGDDPDHRSHTESP